MGSRQGRQRPSRSNSFSTTIRAVPAWRGKTRYAWALLNVAEFYRRQTPRGDYLESYAYRRAKSKRQLERNSVCKYWRRRPGRAAHGARDPSACGCWLPIRMNARRTWENNCGATALRKSRSTWINLSSVPPNVLSSRLTTSFWRLRSSPGVCGWLSSSALPSVSSSSRRDACVRQELCHHACRWKRL
jgi:hypothetical protein